MSTFEKIKPYCFGALGMAIVAMLISPEVRSAAAALVNVTNTLANPVPTRSADNPALSAFGTRVFPTARNFASVVVPTDKILVINDVSGFNNGNGSAQDLEIDTTFNGQISAIRTPFENVSVSPGSLHYLKARPIFIVAGPGTTVYAFITDTNVNDSAGINIDLHGYYIPAN